MQAAYAQLLSCQPAFADTGQESQERQPWPAIRAKFILARLRVENVADECHTLPVVNTMTSSEVIWSVRAEVHLTKIAEYDRGIENQKLRIFVTPLG